MASMLVTAVFQLPIGWLNSLANANMSLISVTAFSTELARATWRSSRQEATLGAHERPLSPPLHQQLERRIDKDLRSRLTRGWL
jgi:hypothetical protein